MFGRSYEPIELTAKRFDFFPAVFLWRGREFAVESVEGCRLVRAGWLLPWRKVLHFRVRTSVGVFELLRDAWRDLWQVQIAEDTGPRLLMAARPRYPLPFHRRRAFRELRKALGKALRPSRPRVYRRAFALSERSATT